MKIKIETAHGFIDRDVPGVPNRTLEETHKTSGDLSRHYRYVYTYSHDNDSGTPIYVLTSVAPVRVRTKKPAPLAGPVDDV